MDRKIKRYQTILESFLKEEMAGRNVPGIDIQLVSDTRDKHFQIVESGWYEKRYIYNVLYHFQIKPDGKVWLLVNNTEEQVAEQLVKKGIPAADLVIGFHPVSMRPYTGFAVA